VVRGGDDGGGHGHDRLLRSATRLEPEELHVELRALRARRAPRGLHEERLEPRRSVT
jgi:hypothetical protein